MHPTVWCLLAVWSLGDDVVGVKFHSLGEATSAEVTATLPPRLFDPLRDGLLRAGEAERLLSVGLVDEATGQTGDPLFGSYRLQRNKLTFRPRFRLSAGNVYLATLKLPTGQTFAAELRVPAVKGDPTTKVEAVYPTTDKLPANLLKFYIVFSRPMREGEEIFERIELLDANGKPIDAPWRRTELWSDDARRLTLYIHPGRIKLGVNLREQQGPVLVPTAKFTLRITTAILDGDGLPLAQSYTKEFTAVADDRTRPLPEQWEVATPPAGTREPLVVRFPEPLDRFLVARSLTVLAADGRETVGNVTIANGERQWSFTPTSPWLPVAYRLQVDGVLEDLAGNTPLRLFETDLNEAAPPTAPLFLSVHPR